MAWHGRCTLGRMEIPQSLPVPPNADAAIKLAQDKGKQALKQVVCFAKDKPVATIAIAAGIGFLLGAFARRS